MRVDPANQNAHRVKPRGVRADTVETTPWPRSLSDTSSDVIVDMLSDEIASVRLAAILRATTGYEPFALHAPIQRVVEGGAIKKMGRSTVGLGEVSASSSGGRGSTRSSSVSLPQLCTGVLHSQETPSS